MSRKSPVPRILLALFMLSAVAVPVTAASAAPTTAPNLFEPSDGATVFSNPVFRWGTVAGATGYFIQVSDSSFFDVDSIEFELETQNVRATPTEHLPSGTYYWRVAGMSGDQYGPFSSGTFTKSSSNAPVQVSPDGDATLTYPEDPPLFSWEPLAGAATYELQIDDASDFIDPDEEVTTENTYYVPTENQTAGQTYFWRVRGVSGSGINTAWSATRSYRTEWPYRPTLLSPPDQTATPIIDVVLEWTPVPGASTYQVQVSPNGDWTNNMTEDVEVMSTRYSPPETYNNASYFWRVRALDAKTPANRGAWSDVRSFRRGWTDKPVIQNSGSASGPFVSWTPVRNAAYYRMVFSKTPSFGNPDDLVVCDTNQTSWSPYEQIAPTAPSDCPLTEGTWHWRVRAMDAPGQVNGVYSDLATLTYTDPVGGGTGPLSPVVPTAPVDCLTTADCAVKPETPYLTWPAAPNADSYKVVIALDPNFTNVFRLYQTAHPSLTPTDSFPDNQAGHSYYWYVRPCNEDGCATTDHVASFRKRSAPVQVTSPANDATVANQVTFSWGDYFTTNQVATPQGEQAGTVYRVEVSRTADFKELIDERDVDQTTYTPFDNTYPEGPIYWRVQATDNSEHGLTWSEQRRVVKASGQPSPTNPAHNASTSGTPYFSWDPVNYAAEYQVQVYRKGDLNFSAPNLALDETTTMAAFAPSEPLGAGTYAWRMRRIDAGGRVGRWSEGRKFTLLPSAPGLVSPDDGAPAGTDLFMQWTPVLGASGYEVELSKMPSFVTKEFGVKTVMTSYAPPAPLGNGVYFWRVKALDGTGKPYSVSEARMLKVGDAALHFRTVTIKLNGRLRASGKVKVRTGLKACARTRVEIQRKKGNTWRTIKRTRSTASGDYKIKVPAKRGKYRTKLSLKRTAKGHLCGANISKMRKF